MGIHDRDWYADWQRERDGLPPRRQPPSRPQPQPQPQPQTRRPQTERVTVRGRVGDDSLNGWAKPSPNRSRWSSPTRPPRARRPWLAPALLAAAALALTVLSWVNFDPSKLIP